MNATNQLFGACDSSGAQKSTATSPQSIVGSSIEGNINGQPIMNPSSPSTAQNKVNSSNSILTNQVIAKYCTH